MRSQRIVVVIACGLAALVLVWFPGGWRMPALLLLGMALGATLYLTSFSFTAAYRDFLLHGDTAGMRAQVVMVACATLLFAPVLAAGSVFGQPVAGAVAPVGLQVVAGAFFFGIGMQLAGGCGSGTLFTAAGGSMRMFVVLLFFCAGSFWASLHMSWWERLPSRGAVVLGEHLGWAGAAALQLVVLAVIWAWLALRSRQNSNHRLDWFRSFARELTLSNGVVLLVVLALLVLLVAGHPWSITWAFTLWGAKAALAFGWQAGESAFWNGDFQRSALESGILENITSVTNIGIMLGALAAAGVAGRFSPRLPLSAPLLIAAVIGGLVMGYGARIAYGCNIGAFFSGAASTSLHGWVWIVAALGGTAVGMRLRPLFGHDRRMRA